MIVLLFNQEILHKMLFNIENYTENENLKESFWSYTSYFISFDFNDSYLYKPISIMIRCHCIT